jgi:Flp pilus assembly protein TadG
MGPFVRLVQDRRGAVAMILALSTPVLIGSVGLGVDTIQWTLARRELQRQADSAAIAGAYSLAQGASVQDAVTNDLARNASFTLSETVVENAPTAGPQAGNARAVRVALATEMNLPFSGIMMDGPVEIPAEATAQMVSNGQYCALSLEQGTATGITMWGSSTVNLGCGMATNSRGTTAVAAGGSSSITASPVAAVGVVPASNNYGAGTERISYSVAQPDPFAGLPQPTVVGGYSNGNVNSNQTRTLNPGNYRGMDLKGNVTLNPGVYVIDGGSLSIGSQARVTGSGVTFILTSSTAGSNPNSIATVDMNGGAQLNLTAPASGTYQGVLIYQDRRAPLTNQSNKINGNSNSLLQGAIYMAGQEVEFTGTSGMNTNCLQLVSRRITWNGNSRINNVCPAGSGSQSFTGTAIRLVG